MTLDTVVVDGDRVIFTSGTSRRPSAPSLTSDTSLRLIEVVAGIERVEPVGEVERAPRDWRESEREWRRGYLLSSSVSERERICVLPAVARVTAGNEAEDGETGSKVGVDTVE